MLKVFSILPKSKDFTNQLVMVCAPADYATASASSSIVDMNDSNNKFSTMSGKTTVEYGVLILTAGKAVVGQELSCEFVDGVVDEAKPLKRKVVSV